MTTWEECEKAHIKTWHQFSLDLDAWMAEENPTLEEFEWLLKNVAFSHEPSQMLEAVRENDK